MIHATVNKCLVVYSGIRFVFVQILKMVRFSPFSSLTI